MESLELIKTSASMPIKVFVHSINKLTMHWHKEIEILLVLEGAVSIKLRENEYEMHENDIILFNPNEVHSIKKASEENILLALQIQPEFYDNYFLDFSKKVFDCKSFLHSEEQSRFNKIRHILAKVVWEINKKRPGYELKIISNLALLGYYLINNFQHNSLDYRSVDDFSRDMFRINNIIQYISENIKNGVTLKDVADNENLNPYYLSHYMKKTMGISFQEYVNNERLNRAIDLLLATDKTITEIAFESGFPSTKSFNTIMKKNYDCSPSQYREKYKKGKDYIYNTEEDREKLKSRTYLDVDRQKAFKKLFHYLDYYKDDNNPVELGVKENICIDIDTSKRGRINDFYWQKLTTFGRASEGLRKSVQGQLRELQRDIGFQYIRFHGIFSDEMMVCNIGENGQVIYNWTYVDELFDFFKEVNIRPFIELGFMPSEIRKSDETVFWWKGNISEPQNINLWTDLVKELIKHCINRYGQEEVETWYFEVWNEPSFENVFWVGEKESYFEFYKDTALAVKSISDRLRVGGPSIAHEKTKDNRWMDDFLIYCKRNSVPLDFISIHIYPETIGLNSEEELDKKLKDRLKFLNDHVEAAGMLPYEHMIYHGKNHTDNVIDLIKGKAKNALFNDEEMHITEWSASSYMRNLINDTCFIATFILRNVLKSIGKVNSIGYWTFTDIMEEFKLGISHFHGGFGLINKDGLKKPSYFAYYLLSKLGKEIIEQGEEYIVTKDRHNIQILGFNFAYFDELFMRGDVSALQHKKRYEIYEYKTEKAISFSLNNLSGKYKIIRYELNKDNGSVFDEWLKIGAPENMTNEELAYLKGVARPKITVDYIDIDGEYAESLYIPVHGAELIIFEKQI